MSEWNKDKWFVMLNRIALEEEEDDTVIVERDFAAETHEMRHQDFSPITD